MTRMNLTGKPEVHAQGYTPVGPLNDSKDVAYVVIRRWLAPHSDPGRRWPDHRAMDRLASKVLPGAVFRREITDPFGQVRDRMYVAPDTVRDVPEGVIYGEAPR